MSASLSDAQKKQLEQAEELLFEGPDKEGFAKDLYFGRFRTESIMPYPELHPGARVAGDSMVEKTKKFCVEHIDPVEIDREARIPDGVVKGLGNIGVPPQYSSTRIIPLDCGHWSCLEPKSRKPAGWPRWQLATNWRHLH